MKRIVREELVYTIFVLFKKQNPQLFEKYEFRSKSQGEKLQIMDKVMC